MKRILMSFAVVVALAAGAWLLIGGSGSKSSDAVMLITRLNSDILSNEPGANRDENTDTVLMQVGEGLVGLREDGDVGPLLASRVTTSDDGLVYTFDLRPGVRFHNGAPLTSAEVVWSLRRYMAEDSDWRCLGDLSEGGAAPIADIAAPDADTVRITLSKPAPLFLKIMARVDCAGTAVMHPASVGADGEWAAPIGTGPFRWGLHRPNQSIDLVRFDGYSALNGPKDGNIGDKTPRVDAVRFMIIPDSSAARAALMRGDIDILDGVNPNEIDVLKKTPDVVLHQAPLMDVYALLIQTTDPGLSDPRMRKAIALSLDVERIAQTVGAGTASVNSSMVPKASPFHKGPHTRLIQRDLVQARALAAQAGYKGQPISLIANKKYPQMFDAAVLIQAMAREAGLRFEIETYDWATQLDRYSEGEFQTMTFAYSARLDPSFNYGTVIGDKAEEPRKVWDDPAASALLAKAGASADPAVRQAAFDQLHALHLQSQPLVVLYNPGHAIAVRKGVKGVTSWPVMQQRLWGVEKGA